MHISKEGAGFGKAEGMTIRSYITKDDCQSLSLVVVSLDGYHPKVRSTLNDRAYYVLQGEATVTVGDEVYEVKPGDAVLIPKGYTHSLRGKMQYVIVNSPAFDPNHDILLE